MPRKGQLQPQAQLPLPLAVQRPRELSPQQIEDLRHALAELLLRAVQASREPEVDGESEDHR